MMYPSLAITETALPAWRIMLALLLAGVLTSGILLSLWAAGAQTRLRLGILLALLALALVLLFAVWFTRRSLPTEQVEAEPSTTEIWLVKDPAANGTTEVADQGVMQWIG